MSSEKGNSNTLLSSNKSEKHLNLPHVKNAEEPKTEKCKEHTWKPILFYCSCGKFLCVLCLKNHCHSNMNFSDIKTFYNNVLKEMEQILKLIDKYSEELKNADGTSQNKDKLESIMYTKKSLINLLSHREILYSLSLSQIKEVKDNNLFYKISNSISDYFQGVVVSNEEKIKKLINE